MNSPWRTLASRLSQFTVRGLLLLTFIVAVFLAFYRVSTLASFSEQLGSTKSHFKFGLYAALAACLIIGLLQQAWDIRLAIRKARELEKDLRQGAWWEIAWRSGLGGLIATLFIIRFLRRMDGLGLEFLDEATHSQQDEYFPPQEALSDAVLLLSLVVANISRLTPAAKTLPQKLLRTAGSGLGLAAASLWLAILLLWMLLIPELTHLGIHGMQMREPLFFLGHRITPNQVPDPCIPLFYRMAISSLVGGVGLAAVRWLAKVWNAGIRWQLFPLAIFTAATALQSYLVGWALFGGISAASEHLWNNRPPVWSFSNVLGVVLLAIVATALVQRWRMSDEASLSGPTLAWRTPRHYYPHEWGALLFVLPAFQLYGETKYLDWKVAEVSEWLAVNLVNPASILHLALALTAGVRLFRWLRGQDIANGTEIHPLGVVKELTVCFCLFLTAVLAIPALALAFYSGWMVLGGLPGR